MLLVLLPVGLPLLPLATRPARRVVSKRGGSVSGGSAGARERAFVSSTPLGAENPGAALSQQSPVARSAPSSVGSPAHHCTLHEVVSRERLRKPAPVLDPHVLPGLLAEKHGGIMEPAPGQFALVTGLVVRALAPLPVHGGEVESAVGGACLGRLLPLNGLGGTGRGLLTATGLVAFAPARFPALSGCGLRTATGLVGIALAVTGLGRLTDTGPGAGVRGPLFAEELVMTVCGHASPVAVLVTVRGRVTGPFFPLTARGHGEEAVEPDVSCWRVWRQLLSPRLPLSLKHRQQ